MRSNKQISWPEKNEQSLRRSCKDLLSYFDILNGEVTPKPGNYTIVSSVLFVLSHKIVFNNIYDQNLRQVLIRNSAVNLLNKSYASVKGNELELLFSEIEATVEEYIQNKKQEYTILFPFRLQKESLARKRSIKVIDTILEIKHWKSIRVNLEFDEWLRAINDNVNIDINDIIYKYQPLTTTITAVNAAEAFQRASEAFSLFRGILTLTNHHGMHHERFGGLPQPITKFLAPVASGLFDSSGTYIEAHVSNDYPYINKVEPPIPDIPQSNWPSINYWLRRLQRPNNELSTVNLLITSIIKYGHALELADHNEGFLEFWRILEVLTYPSFDTKFNMADVCKRVKVFVRPDSSLAEIISISSEIRNNFVHKGQFEENGLQAMMMLKPAVDSCITSVNYLERYYPRWHDLDAFFLSATRSDADLLKQKNIINHLVRIRKKSNGRAS